jgi:hypothetical protein
MRRLMSFAGLGILLALALALPVAAQSSDYSYVRIVRLSLVEGDVQLLRPDEAQWETAMMNMPVRHGDTLATGQGRAEVEFESGGTARLAANSTLHFTELALDNGARITRLTLRQGTATFYAKLARNDVFEVHTPHLVTAIPDDARYRVDVTAEGSWVSVWKGNVEVALLGGESYRITKGRGIYVNAVDTTQAQLIRNAEPDAWDRWVAEREEVVLSATNAALRYTSSPYRYGLSDLYYYGGWYNLAGYGYCWQPYGVPFGWSPFWDGRWMMLGGFGWTWVSYEPWGWLPYHYGGWTHHPRFGWFWVPGFSHPWHPGPVHWVGFGGHVGWIPRSPNDRPGHPPANLPHGPVVNTPRGVVAGTPNQRAALGSNDRPTFFDRPPLDDGVPIRPRGTRGVAGAGPAAAAPENALPAGSRGGRASGIVGRPSVLTPDEPGIVYDKDQRRFVNNPRAPVRPPDADVPAGMARPSATTPAAPPGPMNRPSAGPVPGATPVPPRAEVGPRGPERPRISEDRNFDRPDRWGRSEVGQTPRRPEPMGPPPQTGTPRGDVYRPTPPPQPRVEASRPMSPPPTPRVEPSRPMSPPPTPRTESARPPGGESRPAPPAHPTTKPPGH